MPVAIDTAREPLVPLFESALDFAAAQARRTLSEHPGYSPMYTVGGRWVYRVTARGAMDDVKVVQTFYLVAGPKGDQVVLAFTMKQAMAAKLGARDLSLVESIDFPASRAEK